jgi:putative ABC transport system permease protein
MASSMSARFDDGIVDQRFRAELFLGFGAVALALAVVGLYAVQAFRVSLRRTEVGVRMSFGATRRDIWRLLVRQTVWPVLTGIALGLLLTYWAAQFLQGFLFHVDARDPWVYALVALAILAASVAAAWFPARRACAIDPATALRTT